MTRHAFEYDAIVIGAGAAGVRCARTAEKNGAKVALVELPFGYVASDTTGGAGGTYAIRSIVAECMMSRASGALHSTVLRRTMAPLLITQASPPALAGRA